MDGAVMVIAGRLQKKLAAIDSKKDRDTLVWAHGFFTGLVNSMRHLTTARVR